MNHWAVQPNAFATGEDMRNSVTVLERDQTTVVCPKPRRIGLLRNTNTVHHHHHHNQPVWSLRCHFSHQVEMYESKAETEILDIIMMKDGFGEEEEQEVHTQVLDSATPPFFCGSPPSRVANPLTQDARFRDHIDEVDEAVMVVAPLGCPPPQPSPRQGGGGGGGGCVRGNRPAVRIEGFDCLDRDSRNCSIPALA